MRVRHQPSAQPPHLEWAGAAASLRSVVGKAEALGQPLRAEVPALVQLRAAAAVLAKEQAALGFRAHHSDLPLPRGATLDPLLPVGQEPRRGCGVPASD